MNVFRHAAIIAGKDLQSELRTKESFNAALAFSATILIVFSFVVDPFGETLREMSGGLLWLVLRRTKSDDLDDLAKKMMAR